MGLGLCGMKIKIKANKLPIKTLETCNIFREDINNKKRTNWGH